MKKIIISITSIIIISCIAVYVKNNSNDVTITEYETDKNYVYLIENNSNESKDITIKMNSGIEGNCNNLYSYTEDIVVIKKNNKDDLLGYSKTITNNNKIVNYEDYDENNEVNLTDYGYIDISLTKNRDDNVTYDGVVSILLYDNNKQLIDVISKDVKFKNKEFKYHENIDGSKIKDVKLLYRFYKDK